MDVAKGPEKRQRELPKGKRPPPGTSLTSSRGKLPRSGDHYEARPVIVVTKLATNLISAGARRLGEACFAREKTYPTLARFVTGDAERSW